MKFLAFFHWQRICNDEIATGILEARPHIAVALRAAIELQNTRDGGGNGDGGKAEH
jgi:hypothetical protein